MTQPITPDEMCKFFDTLLCDNKDAYQVVLGKNFVVALKNFIRAHSREGWQDISTAPKDGTRVILWCKEWDAPDCGYAGSLGWYLYYPDGLYKYQPTHWMQLPAAPEPNGDDNDQRT